MEYEDKVRIATPEGVEIELALAGIGSRLAARLIDVLIQAAIAAAVLLIFAETVDEDSLAGTLVAVIGILLAFGVFWGYDVAFEAFNGGKTPGKRALGVRVVGEHGEPVSFSTAAVRNILRLIDEYLTLWLGALVSMVRSKRTQRLGDMAAGTLVVKDRPVEAGLEAGVGISTLGGLDSASRWDTTQISEADLAAARRYLERRAQLTDHVRGHLAGDLAARLRPKVGGGDPGLAPDQFLELLVAIKSRRG